MQPLGSFRHAGPATAMNAPQMPDAGNPRAGSIPDRHTMALKDVLDSLCRAISNTHRTRLSGVWGRSYRRRTRAPDVLFDLVDPTSPVVLESGLFWPSVLE